MVGSATLTAHRRDEYLQAARIAIEPARVRVELDLTPGIAVAAAVLDAIDRNRDGFLAAEERQAYALLVLGDLELDVDGTRVSAQLGDSSFPAPESIRRGEGTIRLQLAATLPRLSSGVHHLLFRNRHHRDSAVYLANALVPESADVAVTAQRRDGHQTELAIDYVLTTPPAERSYAPWLLGSFAAAASLVSALVVRASRPRR